MIRTYLKKKKTNTLTWTDVIWKPGPLRGGTQTEINLALACFLFVWPHGNPCWHSIFNIHRILVDVRCRLSIATLVALVPPYLVSSQLRLALPPTAPSLFRCAHTLPHGFWEMDGLLVVSVVLLSIHHFLALAVRSSG